jgi:hypothetical protein
MEDLSKIMGGVQTAEAEAEASVQQKKTEATSDLEAAQRNIAIATETTGSPLQDGVIVLYGARLVTEPQIVKNYEETAEKLKGKSGQPVVSIHRWRERTGRMGRFIEPKYKIVDSVTVGILSGEELEFDYTEDACYLPTSRYAKLRKSHSSEIQVKDGMLPISSRPSSFRFSNRYFDLGYDLHQPIDQDRLSEMESLFVDGRKIDALTLAIGNEGIIEWLSQGEAPMNGINSEFGAARKLCDALEVPRIAPVTDEQKRYLGQAAF